MIIKSRASAKEAGIPESARDAIFAHMINRVRNNLHIVLVSVFYSCCRILLQKSFSRLPIQKSTMIPTGGGDKSAFLRNGEENSCLSKKLSLIWEYDQNCSFPIFFPNSAISSHWRYFTLNRQSKPNIFGASRPLRATILGSQAALGWGKQDLWPEYWPVISLPFSAWVLWVRRSGHVVVCSPLSWIVVPLIGSLCGPVKHYLVYLQVDSKKSTWGATKWRFVRMYFSIFTVSLQLPP